MRVEIDGAPAAFGWTNLRTLGEVFARAEEVLAGRILTEAVLDGEPLDLADRGAWAGRAVPEGGALSLATQTLTELLASTLDELRAHFPVLREELAASAAAAREGKEAEALESLQRVMTLWQACLEVVRDVSGALGLPPDPAFEDRLERLRTAVSPLDEALRRRDFVVVADLCAYELPPLVDHWDAAVSELLDRARPRA